MMSAVIMAAGFSVSDVYADSDVSPIPKEVKCYYYPELKSTTETANAVFLIFGDEYKLNLKKSKSSNPKVAVIRTDEYIGNYFAVVRRAGKTTLNVYAKNTEGGDYQKYKIRINAVKYTDPVNKFKVGRNDYSSQYKKSGIGETTKRIKGKLSITPKKGWTLKKVYAENYDGKVKKLKNRKYVSLNDEWTLKAEFRNNRSGKIMEVSLVQLVGGAD